MRRSARTGGRISGGVGCDLFEDIERHVESLGLVQVSNLDGDALKARRWIRSRIENGIVPVAAILRAVDAAGYRGGFESEILIDLTHDESIDAARSARLWFDGIWPASAAANV